MRETEDWYRDTLTCSTSPHLRYHHLVHPALSCSPVPYPRTSPTICSTADHWPENDSLTDSGLGLYCVRPTARCRTPGPRRPSSRWSSGGSPTAPTPTTARSGLMTSWSRPSGSGAAPVVHGSHRQNIRALMLFVRFLNLMRLASSQKHAPHNTHTTSATLPPLLFHVSSPLTAYLSIQEPTASPCLPPSTSPGTHLRCLTPSIISTYRSPASPLSANSHTASRSLSALSSS